MDPVEKPLQTATDYELYYCSNVQDILALLIKRLKPVHVQFIDLPLSNGNRRGSVWQVSVALEDSLKDRMAYLQHARASDNCMVSWMSCCGRNPTYLHQYVDKQQKTKGRCCPWELNFCRVLRVNILTSRHFLFLLILMLGHVLLVISLFCSSLHREGGEASRGASRVPIVCSFVGTVLMWIVLWKFETFDTAARIRTMSLQLGNQRDAMIRKVEEIEDIEGKIQFPSKVWIYRTRPRLDILTGLCRKLVGTKWNDTKACGHFLGVALEGIERMDQCIGTLQTFEKLEEETMRLVQRQAEDASTFIGKSSAREVKMELVERLSIPKVLGVRVIGCSDLARGNDPYVRLRVKEEGRWLKTNCRENSKDPKWHTDDNLCEFRFLLTGKETDLEAEVMHEVAHMSDTYIGAAHFSLQDMAAAGKGVWRPVSKSLKEASSGKVQLEVILCSEVEHLVPLNHPKQKQAEVDELEADEKLVLAGLRGDIRKPADDKFP